ncbi:MAG: HAMP domain-containing histidine kinase [Bacteroidetes bacterium]|nr:HAMP domain-containing histidine kinase [Bacteroidota bacterium]
MTLRTRIALLFMVLAALLLGIFSAFVYIKISNLRASEFYERLRERADVAGRLVRDSDRLPAEARARLQRQLLNALQDEELLVYSTKDSLILQEATHSLSISPDRLHQVRKTGFLFWQEGKRQFLLEVMEHYPDSIIVAVAAEDKLGYEQLENLSVGLAWGGLLGIGIAGLFAWALASWGIRPLKKLTLQAMKIQRPHERLVIPDKRDELGLLSQTFNHLLERLDAAFALQRTFIANASHELRTPIAVLMAQLHELKTAAIPDNQAKLAEMQTSLERLLDLIQQLLWMAQSAQEPENVQMEPTRMDETTFEAIQIARQRWPERDIRMDMNLLEQAESEPIVLGNPLLLQVAILNLVDNACKYATPSTPVLVSIREEKGLSIIVSDTGPGVPPERLSRLKEPFFRASTARAKQGSGVGLALTDRIAQLHNGTLELTVIPDGGLKAELCFPKMGEPASSG